MNWAVVGLGVGEQHARTLAALPDCRLQTLCDYNQEKARTLAAELGAEQVTASFDEVTADPQVDAVVIASFDDDHYAQVKAALDAGKHVFVEKPLCRTVDELAAIKSAWDRHAGRLKLSSNLILRAAPIYGWLKQAIESGTIGSVYAFDGEYLYGRLDKITQGWRKNVEDYSVMLGGGIHPIDLMLWLTGEKPETVTAAGNRISTQGTDFRYNDFVVATFTFPSGLVGRISANFGSVHPHQHVVRVYGTQATFLYDDAGPRWHTSRDPARPPELLDHPTLPTHKGALLPAFVSDIIHDAQLVGRTQMIFDTISLCAAADESLKHNQPVRISYV